MREIRIIEPPEEQFSWANEILSVAVGEKFKAKKKYAKTISPVISRDVKAKNPKAVYSRDSKTDPDYVIIERLEDKQDDGKRNH